MRFPECVKCYKAIPWIGIGSNSSLFVMKLSVGLFSGSQALIADSLYSLKDVASSSVIWISSRISERGMDPEHPYGHEKVEFFATLVISIFLFLASGYMLVFALDFIFNQSHVQPPHLIALFAAIVSVLVNIFLYKYSRCVAFETNSPLVATASRHNEADAFSSSLVIIAVSAGHFGILILDPIVASIEAAHLGMLSFSLLRDSYAGLMDKSLPEETTNYIKKVTKRINGVDSISKVRTRQMGHKVWIELTIKVSPSISVVRARGISESVEEELFNYVPHVSNVLVRFEGSPATVDV
jgi:cation diffusion facilitator family transporter